MRLEAVGKRYGLRQPWIVRDVSLDVPAGRLIRLEGRNGSGKSTLLRVLAGACLPSAGRVTGRPSTGYVPERFPPGLPFSGREFLTHLGRIHGLGRAGLAAKVDECLERVGAAEYARVPMRALSKGMGQKVAVAQALLPGPGLLVLDEAWTGLDEAARGVLDGAVAERLAGGTAVVFVDHDARRLAGLAAERWTVTGGRLVPAAAPEPAGPDVAPGEPEARPAVRIEVSGVDAGALGGLDGVRSVHVSGERLILLVEPGASDAVLRRVLAGGPVSHVLALQYEKAPSL
ncbi:MAG TPA: ATP-binding cassette domain-containing protein [Streptosporangiaceae bacterium]|nr:ATP-binding cassette domain-containing protein [Streptosporangiaceae bacterium]